MRQNKIFDDIRVESSEVYVHVYTKQSHDYAFAWRMQKKLCTHFFKFHLIKFKHDFFVRA